ncbi:MULTISPECIES: hypothetical protein [Oceanobacillus]|uniref:Uncharacterized protein n=1 Tax=Oceanobacillus kimchii TaxID=746691 RepID=A0ABQ5TQF1_9BACI|nr:hypothetical protein [Oceanobacillus kimchii]GLO68400.1 hypothetical protein MACH08_41840 [Oceanobacillus kimchii]
MNSLFEIANIYLHYRGGKHVGLAGLVGVIVAIIVILAWSDWIQPLINFIGLNKVAENIGITVDGVGGSAATTYNVIILYLFFCLAFSLIVGIGLLIYVYGNVALRSKFGSVVLGVILLIALSPILIWVILGQFVHLNKNHKQAKEDPESFWESQRLKKNADLIEYLTLNEEDGNGNQLTQEVAIRYLHRMPSRKEYRFLIGITYERELVLLFPRPFGVVINGTTYRLMGIPLTFSEFIPMKDDPYGVNGAHNPDRYYMKYEEEVKQWNIQDIEIFLYPSRIYDVHRIISDLPNSMFYRKYIKLVCEHYKLNKERNSGTTSDDEFVMNILSNKEFKI